MKISNLLSIGMLTWVHLVVLMACKKEGQQILDPAKAIVLRDVSYGPNARQVADVHLPARRNVLTRVVVMLHGGGWADGDKADLNQAIEKLKEAWPEAAIVNMNYRLANGLPANFHPAQMQDIDQALTYLQSKRDEWVVGTQTCLAGVSAGGHLATLYAYTVNTNRQVRAVATIVGPTDLSDPFYTNNAVFQLLAANYLGKTWQQDANLHRSASPALQVNASSPPTFMAYGALDPIVPLSNAITLRTRLHTSGVPNTYVEYPNEEHDLSNAAIDDLINRIIPFFKNHLR